MKACGNGFSARNGEAIRRSRSGFTVLEVLVASSLSTLVGAAVVVTFVWCAQQAALCAKISWSQREALETSGKLTTYIRNAAEVLEFDEIEGTWVKLRFADGTIGHLVYSNSVPGFRDGRLYLVRDGRREVIVARGLTEIQESGGFTTPVFTQTRENALRVAYRVAEPVKSGGRDVNDGPFAASIRFGVCLRNAQN